ncbi:uncharacterized protein LOC128209703 isoform X2 [Mya arenaria]|nr:uncharacterized protein LOC128209703 isoform X2 [Mya arenaria]
MAYLYPTSRSRIRTFGGCILLVAAFLLVKSFLFDTNEVVIPGYSRLDLSKYPDQGIWQAEEFPADGPPRIEHILHQTWKTTDVPAHYVGWMRTWADNHPTWRYMFWTDASARQLIQDKYSHLLPTYDGYLENIRRADAMRYVILYEYGGVYADLDMESLLPLDSIARKYSCILPQEPYEHPIIDSNFEHLVINAVLACRARHPFMKKVMESLPEYFHMWNLLDSTGPHFLTLQYRQYKRDVEANQRNADGVYLAPAEYFFPTLDPVKFPYMKSRCNSLFNTMSHLQQSACVSLKRKGLKRKPYPFSFTNHHWMHTYFTNKFSIAGPSELKSFIPTAEIYSGT